MDAPVGGRELVESIHILYLAGNKRMWDLIGYRKNRRARGLGLLVEGEGR